MTPLTSIPCPRMAHRSFPNCPGLELRPSTAILINPQTAPYRLGKPLQSQHTEHCILINGRSARQYFWQNFLHTRADASPSRSTSIPAREILLQTTSEIWKAMSMAASMLAMQVRIVLRVSSDAMAHEPVMVLSMNGVNCEWYSLKLPAAFWT